MPRPARVVAAFALALLCAPVPGRSATSPLSLPGYLYVSPQPGSTMVQTATNVIVRPGGRIDAASLDPASTISLVGSLTGLHTGRLRLSDDGETILFRPHAPFQPGEKVTCRIAAGIRTESGSAFPEASFAFFTVAAQPTISLDPNASIGDEEPGESAARAVGAMAALARGDPPTLRVVTSGATAPGDVFVSDLRFDDFSYPSHLLTVRNDGSLAFQRGLPARAFDFKRQGDRLTYFDESVGAFYALNALHAVADSFRCGNGYETDLHDLALLPNGHALLMAYDPQRVDMSQVVIGGRPDATVIGLIVQELDLERDVVFQWRSWDHFAITDATRSKLTTSTVDYCHGNSVEPDGDGHILISSRHMDEITKISRATGEIIWRLGGRKNQFEFVNDPLRFSYQHAAGRLPSGNLLLFDNGFFHSPRLSRAVEYALDEERKTATLVWEYRNVPDIFGSAMGNAQRLPNGNTIIGWGSTNPSVTEVTPDGRVVYELDLPPSVYSYRAFRFEWPPVRPALVTLWPRRLTTLGSGGWMTATIEPEGFDPATIDVATITLAGVATAPSNGVAFGDTDADGLPDLMVRFSMDAVASRLRPGRNRVEVAGSLRNGERFRGFASLWLVVPPSSGATPVPWRAVSLPGMRPLRIITGRGGATLDLAVFDVNGRRVRRWKATADATGAVAWNGRDDDGKRLPSGIYFVRPVSAAGGGAGARIVLLR